MGHILPFGKNVCRALSLYPLGNLELRRSRAAVCVFRCAVASAAHFLYLENGGVPLKRVLTLLLGIVLIVGTIGCGYSEKTTSTTVPIGSIAQTTAVTMVCITDTGECYHQNDCFCLWNSKHTITLTAAIKKGYRACQHCEPPIA